ncbi:hypothetical protein CEXT_309151, partial [Caerostris extrusa]
TKKTQQQDVWREMPGFKVRHLRVLLKDHKHKYEIKLSDMGGKIQTCRVALKSELRGKGT